MPKLRVVRDGALPPPRNMAIDEAALLCGPPATLRLYSWAPAGLSLGYFQAAAPFLELPGDHVIVRRLTGGGAIYHDQELTFSLTADAELLGSSVVESYERVHGAVVRALAEIGVDTRMLPHGGTCTARARPAECWCFAQPGGLDLVTTTGAKIVGSAQRRLRHPRPRVLHHGSIPLRTPPAPACGAIADCVEPDTALAPLRDALVDQLARALRLTPRVDQWTERELRCADQLEVTRYTDTAFVCRR